MARTVAEWIAKHDDQMPPKSCYLRLLEKQEGRCPQCTRELVPGNITREHVKPLWEGGENREANLELWCTVPCARGKTSGEAKCRAKGDRMKAKHFAVMLGPRSA